MDELKDLIRALETLDEILSGLGNVSSIETTVNGWNISTTRRNYAGQVELSAVKVVEHADV